MTDGKARIVNIIAGPGLGILAYVLLPDTFSTEARIALGLVVLMLYWWITRPVHLAVTALLPLAVNSIHEMIPMGNMMGDYFNPIILLIFGASILTVAWSIHGLDRRIALKSLSILGMSVNKQVVLFFIISLAMSAFMPNMVVVAALCPIAYSMMEYSGIGSESKTSYAMMLSIAWGAGIGGFGTPMGGAMNLVVINAIEGYTGVEFLYWQWVLNALPYILVMGVVTVVYLALIRKESRELPGSRTYYSEQLISVGRISGGEVYALLLFAAAVILSFARPLYKGILPGLTPPFVFLLLGMLTFFIRTKNKKPLIDWKQASAGINWGLMILFAGGIALGGLIVDTGAAATLAEIISASGNALVFGLIATAVALGMFLANTSSNTAACAVTVPLVITVAVGLGMNPIIPVFITAAACNSAFALPTSIRAVPVGYGLDTAFMFKKGMAANLLVYIALVISGYLAYMIAG